MTGKELRRIRERLNMTQAELAKEIGCTTNSVARWERDEMGMRPPVERLIRRLLDELKGGR